MMTRDEFVTYLIGALEDPAVRPKILKALFGDTELRPTRIDIGTEFKQAMERLDQAFKSNRRLR